uniref:MBD domain-containing protein n=1 Tax=Strigamia maritima TaxID=126957 RepID=T1IGT7_STRMM
KTKDEVLRKITENFEVVDLGPIKSLLGVEFLDVEGHTLMSQAPYIEKLDKKYAVQVGTILEKRKLREVNSFPYRSLIGSLLFLASRTRPDIAYSVIALSQYSGCHSRANVSSLLQVLQYVINTSEYTIDLSACKSDELWAYSDASWASCEETSLSFGGYILLLGSVPILWQCRKQTKIATSTMKSECVTMVDCIKESYWISCIFENCEIFNGVSIPTVYVDASAAIQFTQNEVENSKTKHIRVKYHWLREWYCDHLFKLCKISGLMNVADVFTKWLPDERIRYLCSHIFICYQSTGRRELGLQQPDNVEPDDQDNEDFEDAECLPINELKRTVNFPWKLIGGSSIYSHWRREEHLRQDGSGRIDVYYYPAPKIRLRSMKDVNAYCTQAGIPYDYRRFNFTPIENHANLDYVPQVHFTRVEPRSYAKAMKSADAKHRTTEDDNHLRKPRRMLLYNGAHTTKHVKALLQVLQYIVNTSDYRIELTLCTSECLWAYSDASWASDAATSLSFGGFIVYVGGVPIGWSCHKQTIVACSTMETEVVALVDCVQEVYWLVNRWHCFTVPEAVASCSYESVTSQLTTGIMQL